MPSIDDKFPKELKIGFFKCIATDCPGEGYYVIKNKDDDRRQCTECLHDQELVSVIVTYVRKDLDPNYKKNNSI